LGVPLTLANAPDDIETVVIEMGARGRGHISLLCDIARPTIGVVTTVVLAHAEMFGTIDEVAAAKGELVEALPANGTAVLNGDHPLVAAMAIRTDARVLLFGIESPGLDVTASNIAIDDDLRPSFQLHSPWGNAEVRLPVRGAHQVMNALAAASAALACDVTPEDVARGLALTVSSPWRMELHRVGGRVVLNDAYNANPTSMEAALRSVATLAGTDRVAVVGVMAELGPDAPDEHRRMAALARELGIRLIPVGTDLYGIPAADDPITAVGDADVVLVKGSRVAGLERVAAALLQT
jgi:UDP-N-acetylmuramoyl-tripeptide--D-alanyl-D-alanine ligase